MLNTLNVKCVTPLVRRERVYRRAVGSSLLASAVAQVREQGVRGPRRESAPEEVSVVGPDSAIALVAAQGESEGYCRRVVGVPRVR